MDAMGPAQAVLPETCPPDHSPFSHPREVVEYPELPEDQKRRILLDWLQDELALLVADNEGMVGNRSPRPDLVLAALLVLSTGQEAWQRYTRSARS